MIGNDTLAALEFEKVLGQISGFCRSEGGKGAVCAVRPLGNKDEIETRNGLVRDIRQLIYEETPLALSRFEEITGAMERVRPEGAILDGADFLNIKTVLGVISDIASQDVAGEEFPLLNQLMAGLTGFPRLLDRLGRTFDGEGNVVDGASHKLLETRRRIRGLNSRIGRRLDEIVRGEGVAPFLQDDFITKRGDRWVIPVRMDAKGEVAGVVHDVSNSGETAFMEPLEIIGLSNELGNLVAEEKVEVIRILKGVCSEIREVGPDLAEQYGTLVHLDMLSGIALYSEALKLEPARIGDSRSIILNGARHPLLISLQDEGLLKEAVPLDVTLEGEERVMVITGPNAGGKTIAIKTVGLLVTMAMSGIPVPAAPSSTIPFVSKLLVDIGDEQSIESSLSTFSAHISRISGILEEAGEGDLILLDEVGTGTEPSQGAAIACAILNDLKEKGSFVFATTHLTDVIGFVFKTKGMVNASMGFNPKTHIPLYRLKAGEPGQSHALETAIRYGLPKRVTDLAGSLIGRMSAEFHELMKELKEKGARYDNLIREVEKEKRGLKDQEKSIKEKLTEAEGKRMRAYEEGLKEAHEIVVETKREARSILNGARKGPRVAISKLEEKRQDIAEKLKGFEIEGPLNIDEIKEGDTVFIRTIGSDGRVKAVDRRKGRVEVESGGISFKVPLSDLAVARGKVEKEKLPSRQEFEAEETPSSIRLLGLRVEEAVSRLESYLDQAAMCGMGEVRIIHGIGTGALLKAVREYLEVHPAVKSFRRGEQPEGGDGVTVVLLK